MNTIASFRPLQKLTQWFKPAPSDPVDTFRSEIRGSLEGHLSQSKVSGWGWGNGPRAALEEGLSISSPALGQGAIQVKCSEGRELKAFRNGQELPVKHFPSQRFFSSSGAIGNDPSRDQIDLGGGRTLTLQPYEKTLSVTVRQEGSDATLKLWWQSGGKPGSASLRNPLVEIRNSRGDVHVDEWSGKDGPVEGRLTSFNGEAFQARQWSDGFCDRVTTTPADIERLQTRSRQLILAAGVLTS
jgi:hypothetical protein